METLLTKVARTELELAEHRREAEAAEQRRLEELLASEPDVLSDVRARAERRGEAIVTELRGAAEAEIAAMQHDHQRTVEALKTSTAQHRPQAVERALQLFRAAYGL